MTYQTGYIKPYRGLVTYQWSGDQCIEWNEWLKWY